VTSDEGLSCDEGGESPRSKMKLLQQKQGNSDERQNEMKAAKSLI
jgi:hypothetical protein